MLSRQKEVQTPGHERGYGLSEELPRGEREREWGEVQAFLPGGWATV